MEYTDIRQSIIAAALYMQRSGMIRGTSGNISVRVPEGVLVTPSSVPYEELEPEDICLVSLEGEHLDCRRRPSSETPLHLAVYAARPDVGAVVHAHSEYSTVMASLCGVLPAVTVPGTEFYPVKSVPFLLPGSEALADAVAEALGDGSAVIMAHHGLVCAAQTLKKAMGAAEYVEENARIAYRLRLAGSESAIPEAEIAKLKAALSQGKAI